MQIYLALIVFCGLISYSKAKGVAQKCPRGQYTKKHPSPESNMHTCMIYSCNSCCTKQLTEELALVPLQMVGALNYSQCGNLTPACSQYMSDVNCFFQCSPNVYPWLDSFTGVFSNLPICSSFCDRWYNACSNDIDKTCVRDQSWNGGQSAFKKVTAVNGKFTYECHDDQVCKKYSDVYGSSKDFCNNMWKGWVQYTKNAQNCIIPGDLDNNEVVVKAKDVNAVFTNCKTDLDRCGQAGDVGSIYDQDTSPLLRIIKGKDSKPNAWPWQALITRYKDTPEKVLGNNSLVGGGSIINKQWILTAAHVLHDSTRKINWKRTFVVSVGVSERPTDGAELKSTIEMYSIGKYIEHEDFIMKNLTNDIALIKLGARYDSTMQKIKSDTEGLVFTYYIRPVCLQCKGTCLTEEILLHGNVTLQGKGNVEKCLAEEKILLSNDVKVVATGFGHLDAYNYTISGPLTHARLKVPKILQQVLLKIGDKQTCRKGIDDINALISNSILNYSEESQFCCVSVNSHEVTDTCQGDSGGPVAREVINTKTGEACWIQIGIVSFGWGCGQGLPSYYTNVARFGSWIDSKINDSRIIDSRIIDSRIIDSRIVDPLPQQPHGYISGSQTGVRGPPGDREAIFDGPRWEGGPPISGKFVSGPPGGFPPWGIVLIVLSGIIIVECFVIYVCRIIKRTECEQDKKETIKDLGTDNPAEIEIE